MENKLQKFLEQAFAQYGDFPAKADVMQELLANLLERFNDLKKQGKSDNEAYGETVSSLGDVSEIMAHVPHGNAKLASQDKPEPGLHKYITGVINEAIRSGKAPAASDLTRADLADTNLTGKDFSASALKEASFDRSHLQDAKLKSSDLRGATFAETRLVNTEFSQSDLSGVSFDGLTLDGVMFNSTSLKNTSFKKTVLNNVSFHHAAVKHAIFDGATMDKLTYALLKGAEATLKDIIIQ